MGKTWWAGEMTPPTASKRPSATAAVEGGGTGAEQGGVVQGSPQPVSSCHALGLMSFPAGGWGD